MIDDIVPDTITVTMTDKKFIGMLIGFTKEIVLCPIISDKNFVWIKCNFSTGKNDAWGVEWEITYKGKSLLNNLVSLIRKNYLVGIPTRRKIIQKYIIDFYEKNCINEELFCGIEAIFERCPKKTLLDCTRFIDVNYSGYLLMKALLQFLEQKNTKMIVLYPLGRIELENNIFTKGNITLIKSDYSLGWEEIRKEYPAVNLFDPVNGTMNNKRGLFIDGTSVNSWLVFRHIGDRENGYNWILNQIRIFLSLLFAVVSGYSKNILMMNMPKTFEYCYIFTESNHSIKTPVNNLLHGFPGDVKLTTDSINNAFLGIVWFKTLGEVEANRFSLFCDYFMKSLNAYNEEKLINLFIGIDALWGEEGNSKQTTIDGMKFRMNENYKNTEKAAKLYNLRCELIHGGCSLLDDWKDYDYYITEFGTEPEEDLMQIVLNELNSYMIYANNLMQGAT
ncbi:hypothetical protein FACS189461_5040 [Spirochaetia bacterium]|nr:hypothetical protein FACS189461_5040 [Spirochaetia bacterium]